MPNQHLILLSYRNHLNKLKDDLSPLDRTPGQDLELNKLQNLLDKLIVVYNAKKDATDPDNAGETH